MDWYMAALRKYTVFTGRSRRREYWMFVLVNALISLALSGIGRLVPAVAWVGYLYSLAVLIPSIAVGVRRLHDTGRTGWWLLITLVPVVGFIVLIVFTVQDSQPGDNKYGPNPKAVAAPAAA